MMTTMAADAPLDADTLTSLRDGRHGDPHAVLGFHSKGDGFVVRAWRPDARAMRYLPDDGAAVAMTQRKDAPDVFEAKVTGPKGRYRLEVTYGEGHRYVLRDPYAYAPTLMPGDLHLFAEGTQELMWKHFGARPMTHEGQQGVAFSVWAPNADGVSVVGDFNGWDGRLNAMRKVGVSGVWELFIPELGSGVLYKYEIRAGGSRFLKTDPVAAWMQVPPATASVVWESKHKFEDTAWMKAREQGDPLRKPLSVYEMHLASWRRDASQPERLLSYREIAPLLADYLDQTGFTHVELMPIMEHPFSGSWGYQVTGYYAPTSRFGTPDDFRWFVDFLHQRGYGVIVDWVPAHFPKDAFALARFDGTALYEHLDPKRGEHPEWGTYVFNFGRNEVRSFLLGSAMCWLDEFHVDGLRVDAVASMLYLDYSRKEGEWIPNQFGGHEDLEAVSFLKLLNERVFARHPGALMIAEESTAWPGVSRPVYTGGLGFGMKWNMGWMHDTLGYFEHDPIHRRYHHNMLTFATLYAYSENFVLPLSHDEVVYGKKSLIDKMPGDRWQKMANLRSLFSFMWGHPGKKLVFMGGEFAQWHEWKHDFSLDWHLLDEPDHKGMLTLIGDLNRLYKASPALYEADIEPAGMQWIDANNSDNNVLLFFRRAPSTDEIIVCCFNFSPVVRENYRVGMPYVGWYEEVLNTDAASYGGSNVGNGGGVDAHAVPFHGQPASVLRTSSYQPTYGMPTR
jgi:1,4-alpha-glucan branching enzyme